MKRHRAAAAISTLLLAAAFISIAPPAGLAQTAVGPASAAAPAAPASAASAKAASAAASAPAALALDVKPAETALVASPSVAQPPVAPNPGPWVAFGAVVGALITAALAFWGVVLKARADARTAEVQASIGRESAGAAQESARASHISASAAARNADNAGVHAAARLRQEWINTLRQELAELHALLSNFQEPAADVPEDETARKAREDGQRAANVRAAKIKLMLNPTERPSQSLLRALLALEKKGLTLRQRRWRARWILVWGQILLKEEWDRVRAELGVGPAPAPPRRAKKLGFARAALAAARPWGDKPPEP